MALRDDIPMGYTYDSNGKVLTFKDSNGYWYEYTYYSNGKVLTYKDSDGHWYEYTYDSNGNVLTCKDPGGYFKTLVHGEDYTLMYDETKKLYKAGCKVLDYDGCKKLFELEGGLYKDSKLFMKTINENEGK